MTPYALTLVGLILAGYCWHLAQVVAQVRGREADREDRLQRFETLIPEARRIQGLGKGEKFGPALILVGRLAAMGGG